MVHNLKIPRGGCTCPPSSMYARTAALSACACQFPMINASLFALLSLHFNLFVYMHAAPFGQACSFGVGLRSFNNIVNHAQGVTSVCVSMKGAAAAAWLRIRPSHHRWPSPAHTGGTSNLTPAKRGAGPASAGSAAAAHPLAGATARGLSSGEEGAGGGGRRTWAWWCSGCGAAL